MKNYFLNIYDMWKIYLISSRMNDEKVYKIGFTKREIEDRIKEFKTGNSNELLVESFFVSKWAKKIEKALHRHFQQYRLEGEWFKLEQKHLADFLRICQITHDNIELIDKYNSYVQDKGGVKKMKF